MDGPSLSPSRPSVAARAGRTSVSERARGEALRLIGAGGGRACYAHPHDPTLCIKVPFTPAGRREARRESAYLRRVERLHGASDGTHFARGHGVIGTTRGTGWLFDRVTDGAGGDPSPTLTDALDESAHAADPESWQRALERFVRWTRETALTVRDLTPDNLCVRRSRELELVLIDGFGPAGTLPRWVPLQAYARARNARSVERYGFASVAALLERCDRYREARARRAARGPGEGEASPAAIARRRLLEAPLHLSP